MTKKVVTDLELRDAVERVVEYLWHDEKHHYLECLLDGDECHVDGDECHVDCEECHVDCEECILDGDKCLLDGDECSDHIFHAVKTLSDWLDPDRVPVA